MKYILFVLTSVAEIGPSKHNSGAYVSEVAHPYEEFSKHGYGVDFTSLAGGDPPLYGYDEKDTVSKEFLDSRQFRRLRNSRKLADVDIAAYDAIFFPGGTGPMVDVATDPLVKQIIANAYESGRVVGAVCHGPAALLDVKLSNGEFLVAGKRVAAFTNEEEEKTTKAHVPFLLEDALKKQGAEHVAAPAWKANTIVHERLVTGQNPASASGVAKAMIELISQSQSA
ncbi:MAG TPA: type 1 glutamine amidotransferase domain-containing protein [Polyangium sp.]|nr:type 1 glutamine amidotransferase domain-containing protein [Polyangium sp.]